MKQSNLVRRLMRRNISVAQIVGYAAANLLGLTIVMTALQFYRDTTGTQNDSADTFINRDFLIISKQVSEAGALLGASTTFSEDEIDEISRQPWVEDLGRFTPSRFRVSGAVSLAGRGMSTYMFFESIPDRFFDVLPKGWGFDPSQPGAELPIIISRDYLALYNFGFAASRGLPQFSENIISTVPLQVRISGNGYYDDIRGRVVGFSSRLNTIAVPESFMTWANNTFGEDDSDAEVSRLILRVNNPGSPQIKEFFDSRGIEIAGDKENSGKTAYFLAIMSMVVIGIGAVICLLAFFILMLSIFLLLQKNREKIHDLMMLGYSPRQAAQPYYLLVAAVNGSIFIVASAATAVVSHLWVTPFDNLGLATTGILPTIAAGLALIAAITAVNLIAIHRIVNKLF